MTAFIPGQRILVCDGAMGTMLHAAGNSLSPAGKRATERGATAPGGWTQV